MRYVYRKHCFDISQSQGFEMFSRYSSGSVVLRMVPSPENSSEAQFFSLVQFSIANGELANGQGQP